MMKVLPVCVVLILALDCYLAVPYGFLGVRGKKSLAEAPDQYNYDSIELDYPYGSENEKYLINYLTKSFSKQNNQPNGQWDDLYGYVKRVPYGFTGVRGKRSPVKSYTQTLTDDKQVLNSN
ncbi:uncharacterized protein LOC130449392 [Diorhabda sublineata]|uniref:uncharacterized protein LOC130449392 n=1 Tax=Diorhabda sublineata TaxID=1163346 RepID=UPI0024E14074|nr:uncharacterized protein LOC130449392 [Diorhabda sublineata]